MTEDERKDLLDLNAFLERAIVEVEYELIYTNPNTSNQDYNFLINKVKMYRRNLLEVTQKLKRYEDENRNY